MEDIRISIEGTNYMNVVVAEKLLLSVFEGKAETFCTWSGIKEGKWVHGVVIDVKNDDLPLDNLEGAPI